MLNIDHSFKRYQSIEAMSVSGGNLSRKFKIDVVMGFDGVEQKTSDQWNAQGSSRRVRLQNTLREDTSEATLTELENNGLAVHARDVATPFKTQEEWRTETIAFLVARYPKATAEEIMEHVKLMDDLGDKPMKADRPE